MIDIDIYNKERQIYKGLLKKLNNDEEIIKSFLKEVTLDVEVIDLAEVKNNDLFKKINKIIQHILEDFKNFKNIAKDFKELKEKIQNIYKSELEIIYTKYDLEFKEFCKHNNIQDNIAIQEYINSQENDKNKLILKKQEIEKDIKKLHEEKTLLFNDIAMLYEKNSSLLETWRRYANDFTSQMHGLTKIEIESEIDSELIKNEFHAELIGTFIVRGTITGYDLYISFGKDAHPEYINHLKELIYNTLGRYPTIIQASNRFYISGLDIIQYFTSQELSNDKKRVPSWIKKSLLLVVVCIRGMINSAGHIGVDKKFIYISLSRVDRTILERL